MNSSFLISILLQGGHHVGFREDVRAESRSSSRLE